MNILTNLSTAIDQESLQEGLQVGREEGFRTGCQLERQAILRTISPLLQQLRVPVDAVLTVLGVAIADLNRKPEDPEP